MTDIIARLEKATGPDRELDGDIAMALAQAPFGSVRMWGMPAHGEKFATGAYTHWEAPHYTASLDAAIALVEAKLPGWARYVEFIDGVDPKFKLHPAAADIWLIPARTKGWKVERFRAEASTEPLAILLALFRALAQGGE